MGVGEIQSLPAALRSVASSEPGDSREPGTFYRKDGASEIELGRISSDNPLLAGQTEQRRFVVPAGMGSWQDDYVARILIDPQNRSFQECREDNNEAEGIARVCAPL